MQTISHFLSADHRHCDELFVSAEQAAQQGDWSSCERDFAGFLAAMNKHFMMEEQVLFPQLEQLAGHGMGPVQVMRMEHEQIRDLLQQMADAVTENNVDDYLGASETLLAFMQQHNIKEEQILYTMADNIIGHDAASTVLKMLNLPDG